MNKLSAMRKTNPSANLNGKVERLLNRKPSFRPDDFF
jgi:hypothetical protein